MHELFTATSVTVFLLWLGWGVLHSVLAHPSIVDAISKRLSLDTDAWRRCYNVIALVTLVLPLFVTAHAARDQVTLVAWSGLFAFVPWLMRALAVAVFIDTLRVYDGREFAGFTRARKNLGDKSGSKVLKFCFSHRFVRHPWYAAALALLWFRDLDAAALATNLALTVYIVAGAMLEERKLAAVHPSVWPRYADQVAMLVPIPGRILNADALRALR